MCAALGITWVILCVSFAVLTLLMPLSSKIAAHMLSPIAVVRCLSLLVSFYVCAVVTYLILCYLLGAPQSLIPRTPVTLRTWGGWLLLERQTNDVAHIRAAMDGFAAAIALPGSFLFCATLLAFLQLLALTYCDEQMHRQPTTATRRVCRRAGIPKWQSSRGVPV